MIRLLFLLIVLVGLAALIETGRSRDTADTGAGADRPAAPAAPSTIENGERRLARLADEGEALAAAAGAVLGRAEADAMAALAREGAPMLAGWIRRSQAAVLAAGAEPIPPEIRASLARYFPAEVLGGVRYRVGWSDPGSLPGRLFEAYGQAVTLGDVIVFRNAAAAADKVIWAHEIAHVEQYRRWGIEEFARRYVADHRAVEREAWAITGAWAKRQGDVAASR